MTDEEHIRAVVELTDLAHAIFAQVMRDKDMTFPEAIMWLADRMAELDNRESWIADWSEEIEAQCLLSSGDHVRLASYDWEIPEVFHLDRQIARWSGAGNPAF